MLSAAILVMSGLALCSGHCYPPHPLAWQGGPLLFPTENIKKLYTQSGEYDSTSVIATKAVIKYGKLILLTPRLKSGVPASLVLYDSKSHLGATKFTPFPNTASHENGNCEVIQNAVDMYLDSLGFLWVLDSGIINNMEVPERLCPPKVVRISLVSERIVKTYSLSHLSEANSRLQNIVVDYNEGIPHFFISDATNRSIIVQNTHSGSSFRVALPEEVAPTISADDVLYLVKTRSISHTEPTLLYITYLNSPRVVSIDTKFLKAGDAYGETIDVGLKPEPIVILGSNRYSNIFFRYKDGKDIYIWDTSKPFDLSSLSPIYTSEDCFIPTCVTLDGINCFKVLESTYQEYYEGQNGVYQQFVDLTKECS